MAGYDLIDSYLANLRNQLRWRGETDNLEDELRDHLYTAAEQLEAGGLASEAAQRAVLDRFGEPAIVSSAFAASGTSGLAVPTKFTQNGGRLSIIAAVGWILVAAGFSASYVAEQNSGEWGGPAQGFFLVGATSLLSAGALTVATFVALHKRHGGLGIIGTIGIAFAGVGAAAGLIGWFLYGWGTLIGLGALLVSAAVLRRGLAPRQATVLLGSAWVVAASVGAPLRLLEVGTQDQWGDYPLPNVIGIATGCVLFAAGLAEMGRWLRTETPVEQVPAGSPTSI
jgi:hypothetical protein